MVIAQRGGLQGPCPEASVIPLPSPLKCHHREKRPVASWYHCENGLAVTEALPTQDHTSRTFIPKGVCVCVCACMCMNAHLWTQMCTHKPSAQNSAFSAVTPGVQMTKLDCIWNSQ